MSLRLLLIGQSLLMLIFPLGVCLLSTAWRYLSVSQDVVSHQKLVRLLCATQRQTGPEKLAIKCTTIRFLLMGLMWSLTDAWTWWHLAVCELCAAVSEVSRGLSSMYTVSCGGWQRCCHDMFGGGGHLHCNYVQSS